MPDDSPPVWEARLTGERFGNAELEALIPTLVHFSPLDLDLGRSRVNDAGILKLAGMSNLLRVRIYECP